MTLLRIIILGLIGGFSFSHAEIDYQEPDFKRTLLDTYTLSLPQEQRIELAWALTGLASNFPEDESVSPRLKAMALLLSHHFLPYDRDTVIANFHLRHGLTTRPTGHYATKEEVLARIDSVLALETATESDGQLGELLRDILDESLGRELSPGLAWKGAVPAAPRSLKQLTARVRFVDQRGQLTDWTANARPLSIEQKFSVRERNQPVALSDTFRQELAERYPFVGQHLQLTISGRTIDASARAREAYVRLMIEQLVAGWQWDARMALCGAGDSADPIEAVAMVERCLAKAAGLGALMVPPLPPTAFRDWMAFDHLHRLTQVELITAETIQEVIQWHEESADRQRARTLFQGCRPRIGARITSPEQLRRDARLLPTLEEIESAFPAHLSTKVLLFYSRLDAAPRGTFHASIAWLKEMGRPIMNLRAEKYTLALNEQVCAPLLAVVRKSDTRLDERVRPLANALERFIEQHVVPYGRVKNKGTSTSMRQYGKLQKAQSDWFSMAINNEADPPK